MFTLFEVGKLVAVDGKAKLAYSVTVDPQVAQLANVYKARQIANVYKARQTGASFSSIAFPLIRRVFPSMLLHGGDEIVTEKVAIYLGVQGRNASIFLLDEGRTASVDSAALRLFDQEHDELKTETIHHEGIVTVQPMSQPSGAIFFTEYVQKNKKIKKEEKDGIFEEVAPSTVPEEA